MISLPKDMMNAKQTDPSAASDPRTEGVVFKRMDMSGYGVKLVPVHDSQDEVQGP